MCIRDRSTLSRTMYGDLPPSSNDTFLKSLAAFSIILEPVGPDPVSYTCVL
ncbi:hypothetical protein JMUB7519_27980 [Staphylococcus aureus]